MTTLLHLPIEIASLIFTHLGPGDWLSLRKTCKEINARTAHLFTDRFFKTRFVMFERKSLECLEEITNHRALGQSVEELEICVSHLLPLNELQDIEPPYSEYENMMKRIKGRTPYDEWGPSDDEGGMSDEDIEESPGDHLSQVNAREYRKRFDDQERVIRTGYDIECLTRAMTHLKRCKRINISSSVRTWGLNRLRRSTGILPQRSVTFESQESTRLVHHIIHAVLTAAAASQIQVEVLDIGVGSMTENANRISANMLTGPSSAILAESPLVSLHRLCICLDPNVPKCIPASSKWENDLVHFIKLLPELSYLELQFDERDYLDGRFSGLSKELYIPKLETLTLSCIDCAGVDLAFFLIRHHRTLREVVLDAIQLTGDAADWRWLVEIIRDSLDLTCFSIMSSDTREGARFINLNDIEVTDAQGLTEVIDMLTAKA
ncbi:hypothetical protein EDB81DRAFT_811336 [Dactylonectria macrodidyma]|uniref:F-box domain-containing protein n=1 Tax=Dactylonectria macrodidyma TaxID=307937 RepID=A0A9P9IJN3_9HYPO|nr:hypothetical protein EDB81DRAFT_811336 [Dactylonectria macrodidyma]